MTSKLINLLLVDDDAVDRRIVMQTLSGRSSRIAQFNIETAATLSEATGCLSSNNYDVVLLDLSLPDSSGIDTVRTAHKANSNVPIIVLTGLAGEEMGLEAIREGAEDYLVKDKLSDDRLMKAIHYAIERKQTEQKIENAAKEWRTTFDSITELISILDKDFRICRVNKAFADAFKASPKELIGKRCYEVIHGAKECCVDCPHKETLKTKKTATKEFFEPHLGKYLEVTTSPIINEDGRVNGSVHITKDITKRKEAEKKLKEHDQLKDAFVATVSHEMRTPLTVFKNIISNALVGLSGRLNPKLRENLEMADKTIDRLGRIISNFLDISKIETGKMKLNLTRLDIRSEISDAVKTLAPLSDEKNIELKTCVPDCELLVNADRDGISRVLINLINNAIKFVHQGGHISIRAKGLDETVIVEVEDDGPGIEGSDIERIFDRFVQIEKQIGPGEHGTGLGLSIAKELVEIHGGRIEVQSRVGHGTKFTVFLPSASQCNYLPALSHSNTLPEGEVVQKKEPAQSNKVGLKCS